MRRNWISRICAIFLAAVMLFSFTACNRNDPDTSDEGGEQTPDGTQTPDDNQTPEDDQTPDDTQNPDDMQTPDGTQTPEDPQTPDDPQEPDDNREEDNQEPEDTQTSDDENKPSGTQTSNGQASGGKKPENSKPAGENTQPEGTSAEELRERRMEILKYATVLSSGEAPGASYYTEDLSILINAGDNDGLVLIYTCDIEGNSGYGVSAFYGARRSDGELAKQTEDFKAGTPANSECMVAVTIAELKGMLSIDSFEELTNFQAGVWSGGRVVGLYYLNDTLMEGWETGELQEPEEPALTEEEILALRMAVLEKATVLSDGVAVNSGYFTQDLDFLLNADDSDGLVLIYTCDEAEHSGWGVAGFYGTRKSDGEYAKQAEDLKAGNPADSECIVAVTVAELKELLSIDSFEELTDFQVGAWGGGRIVGLYFLDKTLMEEWNNAGTGGPVLTAEEIHALRMTVLEMADVLSDGVETNASFYTEDLDRFENADDGDGIVLIYTCDEADHAGWGVASIYGYKADGTEMKLPADFVAGPDTGSECTVVMTIAELREKLSISSFKELTNLHVGTWSGGRIVGLYFLNKDLMEAWEACENGVVPQLPDDTQTPDDSQTQKPDETPYIPPYYPPTPPVDPDPPQEEPKIQPVMTEEEWKTALENRWAPPEDLTERREKVLEKARVLSEDPSYYAFDMDFIKNADDNDGLVLIYNGVDEAHAGHGVAGIYGDKIEGEHAQLDFYVGTPASSECTVDMTIAELKDKLTIRNFNELQKLELGTWNGGHIIMLYFLNQSIMEDFRNAENENIQVEYQENSVVHSEAEVMGSRDSIASMVLSHGIKTNSGYWTDNLEFLKTAHEDDCLALIYTCDEDHPGWGITGFSGNRQSDGQLAKQKTDFTAGTPANSECSVVVTIAELKEMLSIDSFEELSNFQAGTWNGGRIIGLYFVTQDKMDAWRANEEIIAQYERSERSKEEIDSKWDDILGRGVLKFQSTSNDGWWTDNLNDFKSATDDAAIVVKYTCTIPENKNCGIGRFQGEKSDGTRIDGTDDQNYYVGETPGDEYTAVVTLKKLKEILGVGSFDELKVLQFQVWSGGWINGMYFLNDDLMTEWNDFNAANVTYTERNTTKTINIVHTYNDALSNENADDSAKNLYGYFKEIYGTKYLTGQMEAAADAEGDIFAAIQEHTEKLPAVRGMVFGEDDFQGVADRAKDWWENGGIPAVSWTVDTSGIGDRSDAFVFGSETFNALLEAMDGAVPYLKQLADEGVPVLWSPSLEADEASFAKLWQLMYSRYTDFWGLNNLIWVLVRDISGEDAWKWYPGDGYVDLLGAGNESIAPEEMPLVIYGGSELPGENVKWLYYLTDPDGLTEDNEEFWSSLAEAYTNNEAWITRDELDLKGSSEPDPEGTPDPEDSSDPDAESSSDADAGGSPEADE